MISCKTFNEALCEYFFFFWGGGRCFSLKYIIIFNFVFFIQPNYYHFQNLNISSGCTETFFMISVEKIKHKITQCIPADIFVNSHYLEKLLQTMIHHWGWKVLLKPLTPKISFSNSLHYLPYSSCDVSLENLVLDKLIIPLLIFFCLILYWYSREKSCLGHSWELKG